MSKSLNTTGAENPMNIPPHSNITTTSENQESLIPPEFFALTHNKNSLTNKTATLYGVSAEQVVQWRWHMKQQIITSEDSKIALSQEESDGFAATNTLFNSGITPYYQQLMNPNPHEVCPIRLQALPHTDELINRHGVPDPLSEVPHSPVKEVVQAYPDRVAFCVAQLCPVYCRYCFRKRRDEEDGLHFNRTIVNNGIDYITKTPAIKDVLITGGDPFIASDKAIEGLLKRLTAIPHVEIVRFGTRTPVTLPYRVTKKLAQMIAKYHPVWLNTHFNCVEEITPEAKVAIANLVDAGIPVGNQSVLLKGINDTPEKMMALLRGLLQMRVRPYYLFHPHLVEGTDHLRVPIDKGLNLMRSLRGNITGMGIPTYIIDTPSGKVPLTPEHALKRDGDDLILIDPRGEIWREKAAFF